MGSSTIPCCSPGRSTPVGLEKPKLRTQRSKRVGPSLRPIMALPTFEERARIWATVSGPLPSSCASPIVRSATWSSEGTWSRVSGVISFSWRAPATVNALNVEPGS